MSAIPSVPGAINVTQLTGNEIVAIATAGPQSAQTTTRAIASLGFSGTGNSWFVNETTGSDTNNGSAAYPFATLQAAQNAAVANNGDTVFLTGSVHLSASLNWAKNDVSLVGLNAPSNNDRARISVAAGLTQAQVTALHPLVNVTGQGCSFVNFGTFYGFDGVLTPPAASVCWAEAGGRNFYSNVQFQGGGDALMAALAGMRSLTIAGNGENLFAGCTLGLDTVLRATNANATLELLTSTPRNVMRDCIFQSLVSDVSDVHITVGAAGMDRYLLLDNCSFMNAVNSSGSTMSAAISANGAAGGSILVQGGMSVGATAIATSGPVYVTNTLGATTSSIGLLAT